MGREQTEERYAIAEIIAEHSHFIGETWDASDYEWAAHCLLEAGYRKQSEWISVEERMPEEDGWYTTYTNANGKDKGVIAQRLVTTSIRGNKIRRWEWQARVSPWIVTHWMPMPEPPKMKGGETDA